MTRAPFPRLSLAHLSAINLPPPALIEAAASAGFDAVGLRLLRVTDDSPGYPLMDDPAMLRATRAALAATGIGVNDIEFVRITPDTRVEALLPMLDAGAELGAGHLITAPYDDDHTRLADRLAELGAAAAQRGIATVLEFFPWTSVPDLATCSAVVQAAGPGFEPGSAPGSAPGIGILVDSLHFDRSGSRLADLADLATRDPARLPFAHLCDAPVHPPYTEAQLLHTAREDRLPPGRGQIDLAAILAALPAGVPLGLEVPQARTAGRDAVEVLRDLHRATVDLLAGCAARAAT
ncbi:sugar phosphate isomerase/epimerase family protein [Acidimangrovimonas sediminis]|uniref:sugar phosphate isomerase/epimerase family protein n=1 Tax=Acidimangrovimonas sediminis TaxID=2056283 RepID=UPI000C80A6E8|nr:sugar phosphate isomerase/epimerase [Acidimangrovimonas sediminis]